MNPDNCYQKFEALHHFVPLISLNLANKNHLIEISEDGKNVLSANDNKVCITDFDSGKPSSDQNAKIVEVNRLVNGVKDPWEGAKIDLGNDEITAMKMSPCGTKMIVACKSLNIYLYSWPDRKLIRTLKSHHKWHITALAFSPSGRLFMTGSTDGTCRIWDTKNFVSTHYLQGAGGPISCVAFYPNLTSHQIVYGAANDVVCLWRLFDGKAELVARQGQVHSLAVGGLLLHPNGKYLLSHSTDVVVLWDALQLKALNSFSVGDVSAAALLPSGDKVLVALAKQEGHVSIYELSEELKKSSEKFRTKSPVTQIPNNGEDKLGYPILSMFFSKILNSLVLTSYDLNIFFLKIQTKEDSKYKVSGLPQSKMLVGNAEMVNSSVFVSSSEKEENLFLILATNSPDLICYNLSGDKSARLLKSHKKEVTDLVRLPSQSSVFASSSKDETVRLWRVKEDAINCIAVTDLHSATVTSLCLGKNILVTGSRDGILRFWPVKYDSLTGVKLEGGEGVDPHTLLPSKVQKCHEKRVSCLAISPKDFLIASSSKDSSKNIKIWSGSDLSQIRSLSNQKDVTCLAFSPVDRLLASGDQAGSVRLWLLDTFVLGSTIDVHSESAITALKWLGGGHITTAGSDGLIKNVSVKTFLKTSSLVMSHEDETPGVWGLDVWQSQGGSTLIGGGDSEGSVVVWRDVTEVEKKEEEMKKGEMEIGRQTVENLLRDGNWAGALKKAIKYHLPGQAYKALTEVSRQEDPQNLLQEVLDSLASDQLGSLILFVKQWNTKATTCHVATEVLYVLLRTRRFEQLQTVPFWFESLEPLQTYSQRHFERAFQLHQEVHLLTLVSGLDLSTKCEEEEITEEEYESMFKISRSLKFNDSEEHDSGISDSVCEPGNIEDEPEFKFDSDEGSDSPMEEDSDEQDS